MITAIQITAIINLLIAFGIGPATIDIVRAELQPTSISSAATSTPQVETQPVGSTATITQTPMPIETAYDISLVPSRTTAPVGESVVIDVFFSTDGAVWNQYKKPPTYNGAPVEITMSGSDGASDSGIIQAYDKTKGWFRGFAFSPKAGANELTFTGAGQSHTITITGE